MILNKFDFVWKENTDLNIVLDVYDKKLIAIIKFSTLMNHFKISNSTLLSQDKKSIDNTKLEQTVKLFEEKLKEKIQDIMLFIDSNKLRISNNSEIKLSSMDLDIIFKQDIKEKTKINKTIVISEKKERPTKTNTSNVWRKILNYFIIPIILVIIQFCIFIYCGENLRIIKNIIEFRNIELFNMQILTLLFFIIIFYPLFIQNIKIKEHLNEFIPMWLSITFIYATFDNDLEYLVLFVICLTSFYFSFLLRKKYKTSILFYFFIIIGIIYNPIFRIDIKPDNFGKIILLIPFMIYRFLYLGKNKRNTDK